MSSTSTDMTNQNAEVESIMIKCLSHDRGVIMQAARHHLSSGGSRVRANLALKAANALKLDNATTLAISSACELLHNASLVHDDLQDGDTVRRGREAVWKRYGTNTAICLGDLMVSAAYAAIAKATGYHLPKMIDHMHRRVSNVISGQQSDLEHDCKELSNYNQIAKSKSGPLLGLPVELCLIAANHSEMTNIAVAASDAIAIAYQITDDISDVDRDSEAGSLNFLNLLQGDLKSQTKTARLYASEHASLGIKLAKKLPERSGYGFITIAEKFAPAMADGELV